MADTKDKPLRKKLAVIIVQLGMTPFVPFMAVGWWMGSEDSYWRSVKEVWKL